MPKDESGLEELITALFGLEQAPSIPIDPSQFKNLKDGEQQIQNKPLEHLLIFENTSEQPIAAFQGDRNSVGVPPDVPVKGNTVTHNHPDKDWGGTLSMADVRQFIDKKPDSVRAVGRSNGEGGYIVARAPQTEGRSYSRLGSSIHNSKASLERNVRSAYNSSIAGGATRKEAVQQATGVMDRYWKEKLPKFGFTYTRDKNITGR